MCIERNKKRKPLITLLSLDFFSFLLPNSTLIFQIRLFFLPRNNNYFEISLSH